MAHNFLFPSSNYPQTYAEELYSPLNTLNDTLSKTDFSRTLTRTNSSHQAPTASSHSYKRGSGSQNPYQAAEAILKSATHFMLMAAQNQSHSDLYEEYMRSKYQLEVQMKLVAELKEELREARNLNKRDNSANDPAPRTPSIKIPDAPPPANQEDFPDVRFWSKTEWNEFETRAKNRNEQVDKLYFLCDESGRAISKARRDEMTEVAKVAFNELYYWRIDPFTWTKRTEKAFLYISATLRVRFPEFSWCEGDWKTQEFAKIRYPDWSRHYRDPGTLTRAKPSVGKRGIDQNSAPAPKPKKRRVNKPPASEVIEIEGDDLPPTGQVITIAANPSLASPPPHTDPTLSSATDTPVISPTPPRMSKPNEPSSSSSNITQEPITVTSRLESMENHLTIIPTSSSIIPEDAPTSTNAVTTTSLSETTTASLSATTTPILSTPLLPSMINPILTVPPQASSLSALSRSNATFPQTPIPSTTGRLSSESLGEEAAQEGTVTRRTRFNPLAGLKVPKPPFEVPAPPTTASAPTAGQPKPKKGRFMVPSQTSLTARNLYALDYEKDHRDNPVTNAEFKEIYDNLDADTLKRYEALSKEKKAASKATSAN